MTRWLGCTVLCLLVLSMTGLAGDEDRGMDLGPIRALDPAIRASLARVASRSALWRDEVDALRAGGRQVLVLTPEQVAMRQATNGAQYIRDVEDVGEVVPIPEADEKVTVVVAMVNVPLLRRWYLSHPLATLAQLEADLDRVVIHEVYGHAFPYLRAGSLTGRCADPTPGERPEESCAIRRENEVRAEARLGFRRDAGLAGLSLARGGPMPSHVLTRTLR